MNKISALLCVLFLALASFANALDIKLINEGWETVDGIEGTWKLVDLDKDPADVKYVLHVGKYKYTLGEDQTIEELKVIVRKRERARIAKAKRQYLPKTDITASLQLDG